MTNLTYLSSLIASLVSGGSDDHPNTLKYSFIASLVLIGETNTSNNETKHVKTTHSF